VAKIISLAALVCRRPVAYGLLSAGSSGKARICSELDLMTV
jgi:hypothetical protein